MTIDITPEAVERTINDLWDRMPASLSRKIETMVRALSAALTASKAETAAAYEAAAVKADKRHNSYVLSSGEAFEKYDTEYSALADNIRALTPADSNAALDRMIADARAEGMREAAAIGDEKYALGEMGNPGHHIRANIPKGTSHA